MKVKKVKRQEIKINPNNPRLIKDNKFRQLIKSVEDLPQMLEMRPIIVDEDMVILGGNMRFQACTRAGLTEVPIIQYTETYHETTDSYIKHNKTYKEACDEIVIKDNVGFGEWDWDILANEWDNNEIVEWGLDVWQPEEEAKQDFNDISDKISDTNKIEVELDSERELEALYEKLTKDGYRCRILTF